MSVDFVTTIHKDLEWLISQADATKFAQKLLFDFAFTLGKSDARNFAEKMKSEGKSPSPLTLVCAEPMNLSYLGYVSFPPPNLKKKGYFLNFCVVGQPQRFIRGW